MPKWVTDILHDPELRQFAPHRRWSAAQKEEHLLFLHYRVSPGELRSLVPVPLELQQYDGSAWVVVIALQMRDVQMLHLPVPGPFGNFGEIDFAALVRYEDRLGLYFLSIEGAHRLTSFVSRLSLGLPYLYSDARVRADDGGFRATSGPRWVRGQAAATFDASYAPSRRDIVPDPGSPIASLVGQYSAYTLHRGRVCELDEVHQKWQLDEADVELRTNTLPDAVGLKLGRTPDLQHYAAGRNIVSWLPTPVRPGRPGLAPTEPPDDVPSST